MKDLILRVINQTLLRPVHIRYCSQTVYEALLGCLRLWKATSDPLWKQRAEKVCKILLSIQRPDGGFDIGYEFNFGLLHRKGDATSPELPGLMALVEYYKCFKCDAAAEGAHRAAQWVKDRSLKLSEGKWAIPYSPYTINEVMVYNGTSFAAGALGVYLSEFPDDELETIYRGMIRYLKSVMVTDPEMPGSYWHYSDQSRTDLTEAGRKKIDYYHQMQQVEMHSEAQLVLPDEAQLELIESATEHVFALQNDSGLIPYLNSEKDIHLWGYCSCASGLLMASLLFKEHADRYRSAAGKVVTWIVKYAWNGQYFYPVVDWSGNAVDRRFYVRSDAWVFNTLALSCETGLNNNDLLDICEESYRSMEKCDFSGIENHASNRRIRIFLQLKRNLILMVRKLLRR